MASRITIVAYHYVRELLRSRYPRIKGLSMDEFRGQLDFMQRHYQFVGYEELLAALDGEAMPPGAAVLTFDDGLLDHYCNVFPILSERRIPAMFFPVARPLREERLEDVHRLHFILAATEDPSLIVDRILSAVAEHRDEYELEEPKSYWRRLATPGRYDPPETAFIKRMLQAELPEELRSHICGELFARSVSCDEAAFVCELYASLDQLKLMARCGMYIGSHGYGHYWLDKLPTHRQREEIALSLRFLEEVGTSTQRWVICYPYGRHNGSLLEVLAEQDCAAGLTTKPNIVKLGEDGHLTLPRLDTNDLPKSNFAGSNHWVDQR